MKIKFIILPLFAVFALAIPVQANEDLESCMQNEWCRRICEVAKMLLSAGANPNAIRNDGGTALIMATVEGHAEVAKVC